MSRKDTRRKAFKFLRSYYDIYNKLENDKDKLSFIEALLNKQFLDEDPKGLSFVVELAFEGQRHQIEKSVKGWKDATGLEFSDPMPDPYQGPMPDPCQQEEVKEEVKEKEEEEEEEEVIIYKAYKHLSITLEDFNKLVDQFGRSKADEYVDKVCNYSKNNKYNSLYLTALNWLKKDKEEDTGYQTPKITIID